MGRNIGIVLLIAFILGLLHVLIVHSLILVIHGLHPRREFPHPQPWGYAGWPEEGTPDLQGEPLAGSTKSKIKLSMKGSINCLIWFVKNRLHNKIFPLTYLQSLPMVLMFIDECNNLNIFKLFFLALSLMWWTIPSACWTLNSRICNKADEGELLWYYHKLSRF